MPNDYDDRHINWGRLTERIIAGAINTFVYGTVLILAKLLGLFG